MTVQRLHREAPLKIDDTVITKNGTFEVSTREDGSTQLKWLETGDTWTVMVSGPNTYRTIDEVPQLTLYIGRRATGLHNGCGCGKKMTP